MTDYRPGDVLAIPYRGTTRYVRIVPRGLQTVEDPTAIPKRTLIQDCDGAGHILTGVARYLQTRTLDTRYHLHHRPDTKDRP